MSTLNTPSVPHRRPSITKTSTVCLLDPPARPPRRISSVKTLSDMIPSCPAAFPLALPSKTTGTASNHVKRLLPRLNRAVLFMMEADSLGPVLRVQDMPGNDERIASPPCKRIKMRSSKDMQW